VSTYTDARYFAHRRDGVTGRQAVVVVRGLSQGDTT
jgi:hypothetical protein